MTNLSHKSVSFIRQYVLLILIAMELLMSFSFLGQFHIEPVSLSFAYIPVLLTGAVLSPKAAALVGTVYGVASLWKASASYVLAPAQLLSPFFSGNPLGSLFLSVIARMLFGLIIGLLYALARRLRRPALGKGIVSYLGCAIHSLLVCSTMWLFFPGEGVGPMDAFSGFFAPKSLILNAVNTAVVLLLWWASHSQTWHQFKQKLALARSVETETRYHRRFLVFIAVLATVASLAVTFYFVHQINYVLNNRGIFLTDIVYTDIAHLQIQFMMGIISLMALMILLLILNCLYSSYACIDRMDSLTGTFTRRTFFSLCSRTLQAINADRDLLGYFLMVDLDHFKEINDRYGHPEGDRALREVSGSLRKIFGRSGIVGRLGGDEFAVLLYENMPLVELEVELRHLLEQVGKVSWDGYRLSCSIGVLPIRSLYAPEELYRDADRLLYAAKARGRNQYVIGEASSPVAQFTAL